MIEYGIEYFSDFIKDADNYWAHIPNECENDKEPEKLSEHSYLVWKYAKDIYDKEKIDNILKKIISDSIPQNLPHHEELLTLINDLFWKSIAFHDLGKVNKEFQKKKMGNPIHVNDASHSFGSEHSVISTFIFLIDSFIKIYSNKLLNDDEWYFICNVILALAYPIYRHHQSTLEEVQKKEKWSNEDFLNLKVFIPLFNIDIDEEQIKSFEECFLLKATLDNEKGFFDYFNSEIQTEEASFPLYSLVRLNYSLLTASDYLATTHYMNSWGKINSNYSLIDKGLRNKIIFNAEHYKYNISAYDAIKNNVKINFNCLQKQSNDNLNELRKNIAIDVIENVRKNSDNNLFYIEAPTGGGKTNVSVLAVAELLRLDKDKRINKVFYVFPFTTLITQTFSSLRNTLGLDIGEIAELHSKAPYQKGDDSNDDYKAYLDSLFMNYPVTLLSHVRFFEILKTNGKESNYLLHRLCNSIVIIDEIQSYSPGIWDKIVYFINNFSKYFNMKFIIMSATLPKIGELILNNDYKRDFIYLIKDKSKYFRNPNFCDRVSFDFSLLENEMPSKDDKHDYLIELKNILFEKSEMYANTNSHNSVYTIIEFIFKKSASEFYDIVNDNNNFFDEVYLLSGTILEPRRKEIIENLKSNELRCKRVLLISTQVVEAGVDIDMDLGFKDRSIIDSEEQLAGRINRNSSKKGCELYIFNCDSAKTIYGKDYRYDKIKELSQQQYEAILKNKDFDFLYSKVLGEINSINKSQLIQNIKDLEVAVAHLNFRDVSNSFKIIESSNISVFVPLSINIKYLNEYIGICNEFNISNNNDEISGRDVWNYFEDIIKSNDDFIIKKIKIQKIKALMSNFIFSIFSNGKEYDRLKTYGFEKYGYLYLESYSGIYDLLNGIKNEKFTDLNFL